MKLLGVEARQNSNYYHSRYVQVRDFGADLFVLNLECCISERGARWPSADKPFFFRAPPVAAETLAAAGVDCVTLARGVGGAGNL